MNFCLKQTKRESERREPLVSWSLWWRTCSSDGRPGSLTTACCSCVWWGSALRPCCLLWGTSLATWCHYVMTSTRKQKGPIEWLCFCLCWSSTGGGGWRSPGWCGRSAVRLHPSKEISSWRGKKLWPEVARACYWAPESRHGSVPTQLQHLNNTVIPWSITDVLGKFLCLYNAVQNTANRWGPYLKHCF